MHARARENTHMLLRARENMRTFCWRIWKLVLGRPMAVILVSRKSRHRSAACTGDVTRIDSEGALSESFRVGLSPFRVGPNLS